MPRYIDRLTTYNSVSIAHSLFAVLIGACVVLWPYPALAQLTFGHVICNMRNGITPMLPLINALAYIGGAIMVFKAALYLKRHTDNANENPIGKGIAYFLAGGALAALPMTIRTLQDTIRVNTVPAGVSACDANGTVVGAVALDQMMQNFVNNIYQPMLNALTILSFIIGFVLVYRGLLRASKAATDPRAGNPSGIMANLFVGAIFTTVGGMVSTMGETLFGTGADNDLAGIINWSAITGGGVDMTAADLTVRAILMFVQIIGAIAFIRGWLIVKSAIEGAGQATVPQGMTHIIGGTMAINIGVMLRLFDNTFGSGLIN